MFIKTHDKRIITPAEHRQMISYFKKTSGTERLYQLYLLIRYTGLRISEALALNVGDVFDGYEIRRSCTVVCAKKRNSIKNRTVSLCSKNDKLRLELWDFLRQDSSSPAFIDPETPVFRTATGNRWDRTNCSHDLAKAVVAAGVAPFSWHDLRHSYGTELYESTKDMELVQAALGHEDTRTTRGYVQRPLAHLHAVNVHLAA